MHSSTARTATGCWCARPTAGTASHPAWLLNLEADPEVEVQVGVRRWPGNAPALRPGDPDYDRLFAICNKANRGQFAAYQKMTDRPLPVVVLSRR